MREIILVALGGAAGSALRYLVSLSIPLIFGKSLIFTGTLVVNLTGCFLIGFLIQWLEVKQLMDTGLRLLILVGFLGGFTTYSTFGLEGFELLRDSLNHAFFYILLHLILGIAAVWAGIRLSMFLYTG